MLDILYELSFFLMSKPCLSKPLLKAISSIFYSSTSGKNSLPLKATPFSPKPSASWPPPHPHRRHSLESPFSKVMEELITKSRKMSPSLLHLNSGL